MRLEKKVEFQEKLIMRLEDENADLKAEIKELEEKLKFAEEQVKLAEDTIAEFNDLSRTLKKYRKEYSEQLKSVKLIAEEYKKAMDKCLKTKDN